MPSHTGDIPAELAGYRILGTKQSAEFCGFSQEYWRRLHRDGKTPPAVMIGKRKFGWRIGALIEWQEARLAA